MLPDKSFSVDSYGDGPVTTTSETPLAKGLEKSTCLARSAVIVSSAQDDASIQVRLVRMGVPSNGDRPRWLWPAKFRTDAGLRGE